jgi:hypothetical protein
MRPETRYASSGIYDVDFKRRRAMPIYDPERRSRVKPAHISAGRVTRSLQSRANSFSISEIFSTLCTGAIRPGAL